MKRVSIIALCLIALVGTGSASAQQWPQKPIRIIVTNPPGQSSDTLARIYAGRLTTALGQNVFIDNRPGAGGNIGTSAAAKAAPDGYTFNIGTAATHGMNLALYTNPGYDPERDFAPVAMLGGVLMVVAATPSSGIKSIQDLISRSKQNEINVAVPSTMAGVVSDLIRQQGNARTKNVPYKGSAQSMTDVLGGHVNVVVDTAVVIAPQAAQGKLVPIGITSLEQSPLMPGLRSVAEQGLPGFEVTGWFMLFAPTGTPQAILARMNAEVKKIQADAEIRKQLVSNGFNPAAAGEVATLPQFVRAEHERWVKAIKAAGLQPS